MLSNIRTVALVVLTLLAVSVTSVSAQFEQLGEDEKIPWKLTVVIMDGVDSVEHAENPVKEAVAFIEARTKLKIDVEYRIDFSYHDYTPYATGPDLDGDGRGDEWAYLMMSWNLPPSLIEELPSSDSYLFLYKMFGWRPLQAGSALPLEYGMWKGTVSHAYATVSADQWWFLRNEPYEGFNSRAAQIITHEIINTIQAKVEAPPYRCSKLTATVGAPGTTFDQSRLATLYEGERLTKLEGCYGKLSRNQTSGVQNLQR
jgi:hypothetical protein